MEMNMKLYKNLVNKVKTMVLISCLTSLSANAATAELNELVVNTSKAFSEQTTINIDEKSFRCIREMTPVRHFYLDNLLGDIENTLAAANAPEGAKYPVGSVVQLVPTEVMVKRESGTSPATGDWEFFELEVNSTTEVCQKGNNRNYSTVTDFAKFLGLSTSVPFSSAT